MWMPSCWEIRKSHSPLVTFSRKISNTNYTFWSHRFAVFSDSNGGVFIHFTFQLHSIGFLKRFQLNSVTNTNLSHWFAIIISTFNFLAFDTGRDVCVLVHVRVTVCNVNACEWEKCQWIRLYFLYLLNAHAARGFTVCNIGNEQMIRIELDVHSMACESWIQIETVESVNRLWSWSHLLLPDTLVFLCVGIWLLRTSTQRHTKHKASCIWMRIANACCELCAPINVLNALFIG